MRLFCAPDGTEFPEDGALNVVLYGQPGVAEVGRSQRASAGQAAKAEILRQGLHAVPRAWDFLSIALSVVTADLACLRSGSADGWTRELGLTVAVADPVFWRTQAKVLEAALAFLSTDRWALEFVGDGLQPSPPRQMVRPDEDCVVLLSGGLDSLIGAIDLVGAGRKPMAVTNVVRGDVENQETFAETIAGGLRHLAVNHNASPPGVREASQRARSMIFIAFGILAATTLRIYGEGGEVPFYVCENGFIAINPPLTGTRLGSLSTRTAHPAFLNRIADVMAAAGIRVRLTNPYELRTKGEMLKGCADQALLKDLARRSVSCGRYRVFGYRHCGRCVPCQVRRASFLAWGEDDPTDYCHGDLGGDDAQHANFEDVRAVAMAIAERQEEGICRWIGPALSYPRMGDVALVRDLLGRGLDELEGLHRRFNVR